MAENTPVQGRARQSTYDVVSDGVLSVARVNKRSEFVFPDYWTQLIIDGRVFIASNAAMETAEDIGNGAYANTEPALCLDVPNGTTVIPLEFMFRQGGTVANGTFTALMVVDDAERITSGTAVTPRNYRINATEPRSTNCTMKKHSESGTDLVCSANSEDNTIWGGLLVNDLDALEGGHILWSAREHIPPVLVGPASLAVHLYVATALPQGFWHLIWAEFPTSMVYDT